MKKSLLTLVVLAIAISSAFAGFTFSFGPHVPLFPQSHTDPYNYNSGLHIIHQLESNERNSLYVFDRAEQEYKQVDYRDWKDEFNNYLHLQAGISSAIARVGFEGIAIADFVLQAGFNSVFHAAGGSDVVGYDGTYMFGVELSLFDMIAIKGGMKHYSGHFGDEILLDATMRNNITWNSDRNGTSGYDTADYVRDNMIEFGVGFVGSKYVEGFVSAALPMAVSNIDPFLHGPWSTLYKGNEKPYNERYPALNNVPVLSDPSYKGWILQADVKGMFPIGDSFQVYAGANIKLHQDGVTNHTLNPSDDDLKNWDMEYSLVAGVEMKNAIENRSIALEAIYHNGRFPLMNFYWKQTSYISVGITIR